MNVCQLTIVLTDLPMPVSADGDGAGDYESLGEKREMVTPWLAFSLL